MNGVKDRPDDLTLRDYFAAAALQGWCAGDTKEWDISSEKIRATACYKLADEMLKAREVKP
jgi:hypothetical protein